MWADIRSLRASPPGYAANHAQRRSVFASALEQSEQLLRDASRLGYASRPLALFYGLSQAGRAITAAWSPPEFSAPGGEDRAWMLGRHGIGARGCTFDAPLDRIEIGDKPAERLPAASTRPLPAFPAVARAVGSDSLVESVRLADLIVAMPEAIEHPPPGACEQWRCLRPRWEGLQFGPSSIELFLEPVPRHLVDALDSNGADHSAVVLQEIRDHYPNLQLWTSTAHLNGSTVVPSPAVRVELKAVMFGGASTAVRVQFAEFVREEFEATLTAYRGGRYAIPSINGQVVKPVVLWWAVLYSLSMLARYHPEAWAQAIDIDRSPWAVTLEHLLDEAPSALTQVIYQTLKAEPTASAKQPEGILDFGSQEGPQRI